MFVRMHGPEHLSDEELLRRAIIREDELERTVRGLERSASELEGERDQAREAASASEGANLMLETAYDEERAAHRRTKRTARTLGLVVAAPFALLAVGILVTWRVLT